MKCPLKVRQKILGVTSFSDTFLKNEMCQYFINLIGPNNPEGSNAESDLKKW